MGQQAVVKARAALIARLPYLDYNYGREHALTRAAGRGDLEGFLAAGKHVTELMDVVVAGLCDIASAALQEVSV